MDQSPTGQAVSLDRLITMPKEPGRRIVFSAVPPKPVNAAAAFAGCHTIQPRRFSHDPE